MTTNGNMRSTPQNGEHEQAQLLEKSKVLHRSLHEQPQKVVKAEGMYLYLENRQKILDATGGAAVACLGHNHPAVKAAIVDQIEKFSYCHSLFFSSDVGEDLCKLLIDSTHGQMSKAFIVSSGSEAMEAAMKMARQYFWNCIHLNPRECISLLGENLIMARRLVHWVLAVMWLVGRCMSRC